MHINTHNARVRHGRFANQRITRLPIGYLQRAYRCRSRQKIRLADGSEHRLWRVAEAEMMRRETRVPDVEISGHAIDRFSQHYMPVFDCQRRSGEGLHTFLARNVKQMAARRGVRRLAANGIVRIVKFGILFVISVEYEVPALITVMPAAGRRGNGTDAA